MPSASRHGIVSSVSHFTQRRIIGAILTVAGLAWLKAVLRLVRAFRERYRWRFLWLSSPLKGSCAGLALPPPTAGSSCWLPLESPDRWRGFCPSCKRPVTAVLCEEWEKKQPVVSTAGNYAFVIFLWGASIEYVLGAMVLGHSIRRTGSTHARVCLHTNDVPQGLVDLLSQIWECRLIEHVEAATDRLSYADNAHRFAKVFTKLRGLQLVEFAKVLIMDIDLLVTSNIDELFELTAPAACRRGMNQGRWPLKTGTPIDGRQFFMGQDPTKWSWGQGTGINAGVMLWQPDADIFDEMQAEIIEPNHPSHVKGNGPEQDYLSRYWADAPWSHISVAYNFQLHQMFFSLHPDCIGKVERSILPQTPDKIKIVHFSGESTAKPWHRVLDPSFASFWPSRSRDAEYVGMFADEFQGHWLWVKKDRPMWEMTQNTVRGWDMEQMFLGLDDQIYRWPEEKGGEVVRVETDEVTVKATMSFLEGVLGQWFDTLQELEQILGLDLKQALLKASDKPVKKPDGGSANGSEKPVKKPDVQPWKIARDMHVSKCTLPSQVSDTEQPSQSSSSSKGQAKAGTSSSTAVQASSSSASADKPVRARAPSCWKHGDAREEPAADGAKPGQKLSVVCGSTEGASFVFFMEGGQEVFQSQEAELAGIFVKVVGSHMARCFAMPESTAAIQDENSILEALAPLQLWIHGVPEGAVVLLAIVGLASSILPSALNVLATLGVPDVPPAESCRALAAIGTADPGPPGWNQWQQESWFTTHASSDIAHVARLVPDI